MKKFDVGADFTKAAKVYLEHRDLGVLTDKSGEPGWVEVKSNKHPDLVKLERKSKQAGIAKANAQRRGKVDNLSLEEIEERTVEYLSAAIVDWRVVNLAGQHIDAPCSDENKIAILTDPAWAFLREVVDKAILDDEVFMPGSRRYSQSTASGNQSLES